MGRASPNLPWPPRSSDPTPCDFHVGVCEVEGIGDAAGEANIPGLKDRIRAAFAEITVDMRKKIVLAYREHSEEVIENDGVSLSCTTDLKVNGTCLKLK